MNRFQDSHCDAASYYDSLRSEEDRRGALKGGSLPSSYQEEQEEQDQRAGYEPMYPSLEDVESVPVLSSGEAFRYAEEQMLLRFGREPSSRRSSSAVPTLPPHPREDPTALRSRHQPDRRRSRDYCSSNSSLHSHSSSSDTRKPAGVGSHRHHGPTSPSKYGSNLKPPPPAPSASSSSAAAIKGFDFLDRKPPAVLPPAATPGAVPVSHHHGTHSSSPVWQPHEAPPKHYHRAGPSFPLLELEVGPGSYLPLHGSEETYYALRCGLLQSACCAVCETSLKCVSHAAHVLCPVCRVVSPVEGNIEYEHTDGAAAWSSSSSIGGVGLGMSQQEYRRCLAELHFEDERLERRIYL